MGLFSRIKDLFQANINDIVTKAEDPEKMLNLYIERATEELRNFSVQVNRATADKLMLEEKISEAKKDVQEYAQQAVLAVEQGRDDLARTALNRKQQAETNLADYQVQVQEQESIVKDLQENYQILSEKLAKAKGERDNLVMRQHRAQTMKRASDAISGMGDDPLGDIERMKDRVGRMEAEAKASRSVANASFEAQMEQLKKSTGNQAVEDELAKLKASMNKGEDK
ncbi:MAG TPA: PspA/IM30 family protein [Verrucomicrobiae bacterium]|nr:PspA/IM30 family protein [Verrucomicrobiae bacterium]